MTCGNPNSDDIENLFPEGSAPENRFPTVSSICSYGMRPYVMTGFLRRLLIQHYADPECIAEVTIRTRFRGANAWKSDATTGLYIESITRWRPELAESRPGLVIKRNSWRWERVTIGGQAGSEYVEGKRYFHGFWHGSHTIFALADKPAEAELLANETVAMLLQYSPLVTEQMGLHRFIPVEVGALSQVEESTKNYAVPITFAYVAEENWILETHAPRLKRFTFKRSDLF